MALEYVAAYYSYLGYLDQLSDAECGRLFKAMLTYSMTGETPELRGNERFVFPGIKSQIDRDAEKYQARCDKNRDNAAVRWDANAYERMRTDAKRAKAKEKAKANANTTPPDGGDKAATPPNARARRFTPPTLEEVTAYVKERGSAVDPQGFIDFYASKGWLVGKTPMKDWKAACRNAEGWERWSKAPAQGHGAQRANAGGNNPQYKPGDFQPSLERIDKNARELDEFLRSQGKLDENGKLIP